MRTEPTLLPGPMASDSIQDKHGAPTQKPRLQFLPCAPTDSLPKRLSSPPASLCQAHLYPQLSHTSLPLLTAFCLLQLSAYLDPFSLAQAHLQYPSSKRMF